MSALKTAVLTIGVYWLLRLMGLDPSNTRMGVVMALVFWGSVMFFFGPHWTKKGFWAGIHGTWAWVNTATPVSAWRLTAWICWIGAFVCLLVID